MAGSGSLLTAGCVMKQRQIDGVRKEKERLTAASKNRKTSSSHPTANDPSYAWRLHPKTRKQGKGMLEVLLAMRDQAWWASQEAALWEESRLGDEERKTHASSPSTSGKTHEKTSVLQTRQLQFDGCLNGEWWRFWRLWRLWTLLEDRNLHQAKILRLEKKMNEKMSKRRIQIRDLQKQKQNESDATSKW